jgi:L-lysine exporter family protein LysE/ArgO
MSLFSLPFLKGFLTCASLIVAVGAQNSFVLRQGLARKNVLTTAVTCSLCDLILISIGVVGLGSLITANSFIKQFVTIGGVLFLFWFGIRAIARAFDPVAQFIGEGSETRRDTVMASLGFSLLNPHSYLDTVVLLGGVASQFNASDRMGFAGGAIVASFCWFFTIAYGARILLPVFRRRGAIRVMDVGIGLLMCWLAMGLFATANPMAEAHR